MDAFVKSFATYRTTHHLQVLSSGLVLDSLSSDTGTITVKGTALGRKNTGDWLIVDGTLYSIQAVKPQGDRTMLTTQSPLDALRRTLEDVGTAALTVGGFLADALAAYWIQEPDVQYAIPYLSVSNLDTTPFVPPETDKDGCYTLPDYARLMRRTYCLCMDFANTGNGILCTITRRSPDSRNVSFDDGRSAIHSVDFSLSGISKLTVLYDHPLQELTEDGKLQDVKDETGETIMLRDRSTWYLSETGDVSQSVPARRAEGGWDTLVVSGNNDVETKVREAFAKNKSSHKLEFWSSLDLSVLDNCAFQVYGDPLYSYISYKRKDSTNDRYFYRSGELATTASEKLRRLTNG